MLQTFNESEQKIIVLQHNKSFILLTNTFSLQTIFIIQQNNYFLLQTYGNILQTFLRSVSKKTVLAFNFYSDPLNKQGGGTNKFLFIIRK